MNFQNLNLLQIFLANQALGIATLCTDGNGTYWTSTKNNHCDPVTGAQLPDVTRLVPLSTAQAANTAITAFLAMLPNATITTKPGGI
jgi:hypothetical protein